jgi:hypothetical protein
MLDAPKIGRVNEFVPASREWWTDLNYYQTKLMKDYVAILDRYRAAIEGVV